MKGKGGKVGKEPDPTYTVKISSEAKKDVSKSKQGQIWYKWNVKVQWEKGGSKDVFDRLLKSVQYELHETFDNPERIERKAPFQVSDSCYAAFVMNVRLMYGGAKLLCEDVFEFDLKLPGIGEGKRKSNKVFTCKFDAKAPPKAGTNVGAAAKKGKAVKSGKKIEASVLEPPVSIATATKQSASTKKKSAAEEKKKKAAVATKSDSSKKAAAAAATAVGTVTVTVTAASAAGGGGGGGGSATSKPAAATTAAAAKSSKRKATAAPETSAAALKRVDSGEAAAAAVGRKGRASISPAAATAAAASAAKAQSKMMLKIKLKHNMKKLAEGLHSLDQTGMKKAEAIVKQFAANAEYEYRPCSPATPGHRKIGFDLYNMNHACLDALNLLLPDPRTA